MLAATRLVGYQCAIKMGQSDNLTAPWKVNKLRGDGNLLAPPSEHQGDSAEKDERDAGRLWDLLDLDREGVSSSEVCEAEAVEGVSYSAGFIKESAVRVVSRAKACVSENAVLNPVCVGVLNPGGNSGPSRRNGEGGIRSSKDNQVLNSGQGVDSVPKGENGVVARSVHNSKERKDWLSRSVGSVCRSLIVPGRSLIDSLCQKHSVGDIDVLPHLVGSSVRWGVLNTDEIRSKSNSDGAGTAD